MNAEFSEFTYGFALTSELVDRYSLRAASAPIFPSLYEEGTKGGYDVELPKIAWFLQFKLSDCMVRPYANNTDVLGVPHYRFEIRPSKKSAQHELLLNLEATGKDVFYCAPAFHRQTELNDAWGSRTVAASSKFLRPSELGVMPDDQEHVVKFNAASGQHWLFSKPKRLHTMSAEEIFGPESAETRKFVSRKQRFEEFFVGIGDELLQIYEQSPAHRPYLDTAGLRQSRSSRDPSRYAAFASQVLFGCELLVQTISP